MDDKRIEELLKKSWQPEPPEALRAKVLARTQRRRESWLPNRWQVALAGVAVAIVIFTNVSDARRSARMSAMAGVSSSSQSAPAERRMYDLRRRIDDLLASRPGASWKEEDLP